MRYTWQESVLIIIISAGLAVTVAGVINVSRIQVDAQIRPGETVSRQLPVGCSNGQAATYVSATGLWGCSTAAATNSIGGVAAGYIVARGSTALDGSNPTTVATGLTAVVSCSGTIVRSTAVTTGTAFLTHATASGANVDWYAWVIAGTASTGTENFEWVCVGT